MRTALLAAAAFLALSAPAFAEGQAAAAQPTSLTAPADASKKLICRYRTHEGMLIGRPICMTKSQWALALYKAQQEVSDFQQRHYSR